MATATTVRVSNWTLAHADENELRRIREQANAPFQITLAGVSAPMPAETPDGARPPNVR